MTAVLSIALLLSTATTERDEVLNAFFSPFRIFPVQTDMQKSVLFPALDLTLLLLLKINHILVFTDPLTAPQC